MKCPIFNNYEAIKPKMREFDLHAQKYELGRDRINAVEGLPSLIYCDGQFHIRTKGAWGVDTAICKCPQWTGEAMVEAVRESSPVKEVAMTWETYRDHSGDGARVKAWAASGKQMLILNGSSGLGKTHLARALQYQFTDENKSCEYISAESLKIMFLDAHPQNRERVADHYDAKRRINRLKSVDVLIIDDLGTESRSGVTDTMMSGLKALIDEMRGRLIITLNLSISEENTRESLGQYGGRICSRIIGGAEIIAMRGTDYRKKLA